MGTKCRCKVIEGKHATACPAVKVALPDHNDVTLLRQAWELYKGSKGGPEARRSNAKLYDQ